MAEQSRAMEQLVDRLTEMGEPQSARLGSERDRLFVRLCSSLRPRIRHLVHRYGLADMMEDAEQVCAIGIHRALQSYDPAKASFGTHVTWQLRGELQSLRHRVRLDQRQSAKTANIRTLSLDALTAETSDSPETFEIVDEDALRQTERSANHRMVQAYLSRLLDRIGANPKERPIILDVIFDRNFGVDRHGKTREQRRQIVRRTLRNCAKEVSRVAAMAA